MIFILPFHRMLTSGLPTDISIVTRPLLLAHLLQWGLLGALSVQVYNYYLAFPKDPSTTKIVVYAVYAVELTQMILFSIMVFKEFVTGFGNLVTLPEMGDFWFAVPILSSTVAFTVQSFYAYRIKLLAKSNFLALVVVLFALVQLGGGIATGVLAYPTRAFSPSKDVATVTIPGIWNSSSVHDINIIIASIWNASSVVCDIIIAVSMTCYLSRHKTPWKQTQRMVQKLITLIIGTGTLTAAIAIVSFILVVRPESGHANPIYITTTGILGKTYSTTMMVVLNNRISIRTQDECAILGEHLPLSSSVSNPGVAFGAWPGDVSVTRKQWA